MSLRDLAGLPMDESLIRAITLLQGQRFAEAAPLFEAYLTKYKNRISEGALAEILGSTAVCFWQSGSLEKAIQIYEELLPIRRRTQGEIKYALSLSNMGQVYAQQNKFDDALKCVSNAIIIHNNEGSPPGYISSAYQHLSFILQKTGRLRQALKAMLVSLKYSANSPQSRDFFDNLRNVVEILTVLNLSELALQIIDEGIELASNAGDSILRNTLLIEKAMVFKELNKFKQAEQILEGQYEYSKHFNDGKGMIEALYSLGMLYQDMGNFPFALMKLKECSDLCKQVGDNARAAHLDAVLQQLFFKPLLDKKAFDKEIGKSKDELSKLSDEISEFDEGIIKLETEIKEISALTDKITSMAMSEDNQLIAFGSVNKAFKIWNIDSKSSLLNHKPGINMYSTITKFIPNSNIIIFAADITNPVSIQDSSLYIILQKFYLSRTVDNQYKIVNEISHRLKVLDQEARLLGFSEDCKKLFLISDESVTKEVIIKEIFEYDTETGLLINTYKFSDDLVTDRFILFNFEKNQVFFLNNKNNLEIRNYVKDEVIIETKPHCWPLSYLSISRDMESIAYENQQGNFEVWGMKNNSLIAEIRLSGERVEEIDTNLEEKYRKYISARFGSIACKLSDDGSVLAFAGADKNFYIYSVSQNKNLKEFPLPFDNHIVYLEFINTNSKLLLATYKHESYIIDIP